MGIVTFFRDDGISIPQVPVAIEPFAALIRNYVDDFRQGARDAVKRGDPAAVPAFEAAAAGFAEQLKLHIA